jgi:cytosine/adenosine deaminase-related metal-dependent hydrolase
VSVDASIVFVEPTPPVYQGHVTAFEDVSVVTMESSAIAPHQTVVVDGNAITAIGSAGTVDVPPGATVIDGTGKFLMPGLHDMHVHLDYTRGMLELFVAAGVTTVRNMAGSPRTVALRKLTASGAVLGPTIYTAGPFVDGARPRWEASASVVTAADAARVIDDHVRAGYDFVKIYNGLTPAAYDAVAAAAKLRGLRIAGHVPFRVSLQHALDTGQASIEHLLGYAEAVERDDSPVRRQRTTAGTIKRWMYADPLKMEAVAAETARHATWNTPTLVTAVAYGDLYRGKTPSDAGDLETISPDWRARWDPKHAPRHYERSIRHAMEQAHDKALENELAMVRELVAAGAPILAGTDTPNPYVVPGQSLHHELALFVEAGLSPYSALRAATIDAADFLGDRRDGRIAVGAHADLVMLEADPLADIHALDRIAGVMLHGRWLDETELQKMHDGLVAEYRDPAWDAPIDLSAQMPGASVLQYVVADNGAPVGAYAAARRGDTLVERQTLEDDTTSTRVTYSGHRARTLALDVARAEGTTHADYRSTEHRLLSWLTPATAYELVEPIARADAAQVATPSDDESDGSAVVPPGAATSFSVDTPDVDAPGALERGTLTITRVATRPEDHTRTYRLRLVLDHVAQVARITLGADGLPREFRIASTTRPVVRTWTRRR